MKVLILGDGILGSELHSQTNWDIASRKLTNLNILDTNELISLIQGYNVVVNCIANTDAYTNDPSSYLSINYGFPSELCKICNLLDVKLVHISTEFVYARNKPFASEDDLPLCDNTWYSYTKLLADEYIKLNSYNYLICRELHKPNPFPYPKVWNVQTSGDLVDKIASLIILLINKNASGVFNVGTGDKYLHELAPDSEIIEAPSHVPKDTRMDLSKLNNFLNE